MNATPLVALPGTLPGTLLEGRSLAALLQGLPTTTMVFGAGRLAPKQQAAMAAAHLHPFLAGLATPKEPCP